MARSSRTSGSLFVAIFAAAIAGLVLAGCGGTQSDSDLSEAAKRGRTVYMSVCIACHNGDPNEDGTIGPAIAGSSLELLEAKVLRAEYPEGYEPKRVGIVMPRFEYLEEKIPDLAAFLAEVKR